MSDTPETDAFEKSISGTPAYRLKCALERLRHEEVERRQLEEQLRAVWEQAEGGVFVEHKCPAFYACCAIMAEKLSAPGSKGVQPSNEGDKR